MAGLSPLQEFQALRQIIQKMHQEQYTGTNIEVGDFSYGVPIVHLENEGIKFTIGKFCSIASNVTIMLGGEHRVDWNSLVTKSVLEPYTVVGGVLKRRFSETVTLKLCEVQWWNWNDEDIVAAIPLLQSSDIDGLWKFYKEHVKKICNTICGHCNQLHFPL